MTADEGMSASLTDRSRRAIGRAGLIARERGARAIDTHHILLALIQAGTGIGSNVLAELGLQPKAVLQAVDRVDPPRETPAAAGGLVLTRLAEEAIDLGCKAAASLGHEVVGTEHLVLGLLEQRAGAAEAVLAALGVQAVEVRQVLAAHLHEDRWGRRDSTSDASSCRGLHGPDEPSRP